MNQYVLKNEMSFEWGWGRYYATFSAGTPVTVATNLPRDEDGNRRFWINGNPSEISKSAPIEDFVSWDETYGFIVNYGEVTEL